MKSGVPQGSVLGPFLYTLFTADIPQQNSTIISTFSDDTAVLSRHANLNIATANPPRQTRKLDPEMEIKNK
jgi:hypothetical protein